MDKYNNRSYTLDSILLDSRFAPCAFVFLTFHFTPIMAFALLFPTLYTTTATL